MFWPKEDLFGRNQDVCQLCFGSEEFILYLFLSCPIAVSIWETIFTWLGLPKTFEIDFVRINLKIFWALLKGKVKCNLQFSSRCLSFSLYGSVELTSFFRGGHNEIEDIVSVRHEISLLLDQRAL